VSYDAFMYSGSWAETREHKDMSAKLALLLTPKSSTVL
jgi:hypothetical protein